MGDTPFMRIGPRKAVTKCPVCGRPDGCSISADRTVVACVRTYDGQQPGGWKWLKDSQGIAGAVFKRADVLDDEKTQRKKKPRGGAAAWTALQRKLELAATEERLAELSDALALPISDLQALDVGFSSADLDLGDERDGYPSGRIPRNVPTFPLRSEIPGDKPGRIVGIQYRSRHKKIFVRGTRAQYGVFIPRDLADLPDPVLIVEGHTNVVACHSIGTAAVGRPGAAKTAPVLARLLYNRTCIVVGDFDPKPSGDWPGKRMAEETAGALATTWNRTVSWGLPPDETKDVRDWITAQLEKHDPAEVRRRLLEHLESTSRDAHPGGQSHPQTRECIANVQEHWPDDEKRSKPKLLAIPLPQIRSHLLRLTSGWPNRVSGVPFSVEPARPVGELPDSDSWRLLSRPEDLFAWIQETFDVRWTASECSDAFSGEIRNPPSQAQFHASLRMYGGRNYSSVEMLPHEPKMRDSFYLPVELPEPTGEALRELADHFNAETEYDRALIIACFLTMAWGGPCGKRPTFVFTSEHGRGVGKTATAMMLAEVWGGAMMVEEHEDWQQVRARLLDEASLSMRVVIIDNIRGRFARSGFEQTVTAPVIDGKRMYVGQFCRPNNLTWLLTANTANLSSDITQRAIPIRIGRPRHAGAFEQWVIPFMRNNRAQLISDALHTLKRGPAAEIDPQLRDRWNYWIDGVLACLPRIAGVPSTDDLLRHIHEQRPAMDQDLQDAKEVADVLRSIAQRLGFISLEEAAFSVRKEHLREWLVADGVVDNKLSTRALTSWLRDKATFPPLKGFTEQAGRSRGRRWQWIGESGDPDNVQHYELGDDNGPGSSPPSYVLQQTATMQYEHDDDTNPPPSSGLNY